jgi:FAD:protein FMN transferase
LTRRAAALLAAAVLGCARLGRAPTPESDAAPDCPALVSDGQYRMGTVLEISLCAPDRARGQALLADAFAKTADLEHVFSTFDATSDASAVNRAAGRGPRAVSPALVRLVGDSLALTRATKGSFDVTVGPLMALWSAAARAGQLPTDAALVAARARVGPGVVRADAAAGTVELRVEGAALDLGGIAKGWTLDRLEESLRAAGVARALLSFGESSLAAVGSAPGWEGWGVALRDAGGGFAGTVELRDRSLSVSGSLGQFVSIAGHRYGHVIDPTTGRPLERARMAAVLASDGATAEALSKALLVLGERDGIALLESLPGADGILIDESGKYFETKGFEAASHYRAGWPEKP